MLKRLAILALTALPFAVSAHQAHAATTAQPNSDIYSVQLYNVRVCAASKYLKHPPACLGSDHAFSLRSFAGGHLVVTRPDGTSLAHTTISTVLARLDGDTFIPVGEYTAPAALSHGVWAPTLPSLFRACKATPQPGTTYQIDVYANGTRDAGLWGGADNFTLRP